MWLHELNERNRIGRCTIIYKNTEDAEMAECIMNETEIENRTLQVHIGLPPSHRKMLHDKREKERIERIKKKTQENMLRQEKQKYDRILDNNIYHRNRGPLPLPSQQQPYYPYKSYHKYQPY